MMRSVQRILAVFESFSPDHTSLTLQQIADRIDLPKSTTFRIVQSIEEAGYLLRQEDQRYCLTFRFTRLAGLVKNTLAIRDIARPLMVELAQKTDATVSLHTVVARNRVCIDVVASAAPLRVVVQPGEQIPLRSGSGSKVLMAYMPRDQLAPIVSGITRATKQPQSKLLAELAEIRVKGYAVSHGERLVGLSAVSAPIMDSNNEVKYCLSVAVPSARMLNHEKDFIKPAVKAAASVSRQYGARLTE